MSYTRHNHIHVKDVARERDGLVEHLALCGAQSCILSTLKKGAEATTNCPKCSALYFGKLIEGRCEIVKCANPYDVGRSYKQYRSQYEFRVGGELRGFITCEQGWGAGWTVRAADNAEDDGHVKIAYAAEGFESHWRRGETFESKEKAAHAALGRMKTHPQFLPPAMTPEAFLAQKEADRRERKAQAHQEKVERLADNETRLIEHTAELAALRKHRETLRSINAERVEVADAVRYAVKLLDRQIENLTSAINNCTGRISNYRKEIGGADASA